MIVETLESFKVFCSACRGDKSPVGGNLMDEPLVAFYACIREGKKVLVCQDCLQGDEIAEAALLRAIDGDT